MGLYEYENITHNRTVEAYYNAIIKLVLKHRSVKAVTVAMILEETNTARQTFYNHFCDKHALVNYVHYHDSHAKTGIPEGGIEGYIKSNIECFTRFYNKKEFYQIITQDDDQNCFNEYYKRLQYENSKHLLKTYYGEDKYDAAMDHMALVFTDGLCTSTINWLKSGCTSATIEEKAVLCSKFLTPELRYLIEHPIPEISIGNFNK